MSKNPGGRLLATGGWAAIEATSPLIQTKGLPIQMNLKADEEGLCGRDHLSRQCRQGLVCLGDLARVGGLIFGLLRAEARA